MRLDFTRLTEISLRTAKNEFNEPGETIAEDFIRSNIVKEESNSQEYQSNIKTSNQLQTDILKGIKAGESVYILFLKAVKAISLMTSNSLFYSQIEDDIAAIYGTGLLEPDPLKLELEAVEGRLAKLKMAQKRGGEPEDSRQRIADAIKAHEARAEKIKNNFQ